MAEDTIPYGAEFAGRVADYLEAEGSLCNRHRDDCGMGFHIQDGAYIYTHIDDGIDFYGPGETPDYRSFPNRAEFVTWLAGQSDASLVHVSRAWMQRFLDR